MLMKKLNYRWRDTWYRTIEPLNGTVEDRAAELVNALLCEGFTVYIEEDKIVEKAVNADFELEVTRWITNHSDDLLCIKIKYGETALYKHAKKLSGARWQKGYGMIVNS